MPCRFNKERTVTQSAFCPVCRVRLDVRGISFDGRENFCSASHEELFVRKRAEFMKSITETYYALIIPELTNEELRALYDKVYDMHLA